MVDYIERCCGLCLKHHGNSWLCLLGRYTREQKPRLGLCEAGNLTPRAGTAAGLLCQEIAQLGGDSQEVAWPVLRGKKGWWCQE